jgi:HSP20 family protein
LNDFRRSFDQLFENAQTGGRRPQAATQPEWNFTPAVETGWTDDHLNLRVVLPGVAEKDLKMTIQGNSLIIQGERRPPENFGKEGMVYNRLAYGKFERALELPSGLDLENLNAYLHDGVLDIRVPIAQAVKPKQVPITTARDTQKTIAA